MSSANSRTWFETWEKKKAIREIVTHTKMFIWDSSIIKAIHDGSLTLIKAISSSDSGLCIPEMEG